MESFPKLYWSERSEGERSRETREATATSSSRVGYALLAAIFIVFFVIDELLHKFRESRRRKVSTGQNRASSAERDVESER